MAHLYQRGRVWWVTYSVDGRRQRESLKTTDKRIANSRRAKLEEDLARGTHRRLKAVTCESLLEEYEPYHRGTHDERVHRTSVSYIRRFLKWSGVTKPSSIRQGDIQRFLTDLLAKGLKAQTVNNNLSTLSRFFQYAVIAGYVAENPVDGVPRVRPKRNPVRPYTADEMERILELAKGYSEPLWLVMIAARYTGLRAKELRTLRWEDIDFDREPLTAINVRPSKHTQEVRTIPMHPALVEILKPLAKKKGEVFLTKMGHTWTDYNLTNRMKSFRLHFGLEGVGLHRFRKTLATEILRTTGNLKFAKEMLRHKTLQVTDEFYTAFFYKDLCRSMLAIEEPEKPRKLRIVKPKKSSG